MKRNPGILIILLLACAQFVAAQVGWEISTNEKNNYVPTCVANGQIGIVPDVTPFRTREVVLNHVFDRAAPYDVSRVLSGINPFNLVVAVNGDTIQLGDCGKWEQVLNMREASLKADF
ncbi:hypothetical protein KEM09_04975 [Carboxylicivirga mesophila]|uniref:Uncharacterized protein n=1 Tax=Carboxylicivirga mesophila TaxID=1166478 RepID=A0ABS5K709_9BACT|nr:hypothetical protein [Carboxylicivirga mesophila]MBS2210739.1 hypothetical protein [Carboxylicivirga mesophila]